MPKKEEIKHEIKKADPADLPYLEVLIKRGGKVRFPRMVPPRVLSGGVNKVYDKELALNIIRWPGGMTYSVEQAIASGLFTEQELLNMGIAKAGKKANAPEVSQVKGMDFDLMTEDELAEWQVKLQVVPPTKATREQRLQIIKNAFAAQQG